MRRGGFRSFVEVPKNEVVRFVALVVVVSACTPTTEPRCTLTTPGRSPPALAVVRGATSVSFQVEGPACELSDVLTVSSLLDDPTGSAVAVSSTFTHDPDAKTIDITLAFPPLEAGPHAAQVFIEPAISVHQFPLLVMYRATPPILETFDAPCLEPARTLAGTTFCRGPEGVTAIAGSARTPFPKATRAIATGNVVWLIQDEVVVRLEDRGSGQLVTTATRAVPGSKDATLVVDETTAFVGSLRLDLATDNANRPVLQPGLSGSATTMLVANGRRTLESRNENLCDLTEGGACLNGIGRLWAVEDGWLSFLSGPAPTTIRRVRRGATTLDPATLPIPTGYRPFTRPTRFDVGGEAPMLLVPLPDAGVQHVVEMHQTADGLSLTAFDVDVVLGTSRGWLFAPGNDANQLRAFLLTP